MKKEDFVKKHLPAAAAAGKKFGMNTDVILAQASLESGWGISRLANESFNFFGITAYGAANPYWAGEKHAGCIQKKSTSLTFRAYASAEDSFMDFARLISSAYPLAHSMSFHPEAYAKEIAYSRYISESNGDNREAYRRALVSLTETVRNIKAALLPPSLTINPQ